MEYTLNLDKILKHVMTPEMARAMEIERNNGGQGPLSSFKFVSKGKAARTGSSHVVVTSSNDIILLEDVVRLEEGNRGFETDISALKCCMFYDLGATSKEGGVSSLAYSGREDGCAVSFRVGKDKAPKAVWHYLDIASEVMSEFFKGYSEIDLALSMARERGMAQFRR